MNLKLDESIPRILFRTRTEPQTYDALATLVLADLREQEPTTTVAIEDLKHKIKDAVDRLVKHGWVQKRFEAVTLSYLGIERLRAGTT